MVRVAALREVVSPAQARAKGRTNRRTFVHVNRVVDIEIFPSPVWLLARLETISMKRSPFFIKSVDETIVVEFLEDAHIGKLLRLDSAGFRIFLAQFQERLLDRIERRVGLCGNEPGEKSVAVL